MQWLKKQYILNMSFKIVSNTIKEHDKFLEQNWYTSLQIYYLSQTIKKMCTLGTSNYRKINNTTRLWRVYEHCAIHDHNHSNRDSLQRRLLSEALGERQTVNGIGIYDFSV